MIAGRYRLDERVGAGGMGVVWRATDLELGRTVVLKQSQDGDNGQIRREARIGAGLHHPNVITVFDTVVHDGDRWLVTEYMPARNLGAVIDDGGPLPPGAVARIGAQLANARADATATGGGQVVGTPGYLAPEVVDGHEATAAADMYSLGATLFAAVEGISPTGDGRHGPFAQMRRAAVGELEPVRLAGPLRPVLLDLLHHDRTKRPSARAAKAMLDELAGGSTPVEPLPRKRWIRRRRAVTVGAAAVVLAAVAATVVYVAGRPEPVAVPIGTVGDPRTADPCALINVGTADRFGKISTLDTEYGAFLRCGVLIRQSDDDTDLVDARVEITLPAEYASQPHVAGQLSDIERIPEKNGECRRTIQLADTNLLTIAARHKQDRPAPLCAVAEALANDAYATLSRGPVPRRKEPFAAGSLGGVRACEMLTPDEVAEVTAVPGFPAARFRPEPDLGDWACWWGKDPVEADVAFHRDYPLDPRQDGLYTRIGGRDAYRDTGKSGDDGHDFCEITVVSRDYRKDAAWNTQWQETVKVTVETEEAITVDQLCAKSVRLTERVVARLPRA